MKRLLLSCILSWMSCLLFFEATAYEPDCYYDFIDDQEYFVINDDGVTVTMVGRRFDYIRAGIRLTELSLDYVTNPSNGKKYLITKYGNGNDYLQHIGQLEVDITSNILEIAENAFQTTSASPGCFPDFYIKKGNNIKRIGKNAFDGHLVSLWVNSDCEIGSLEFMPHFVHFADREVIDADGSALFDQISSRYKWTTLEVDATTPPEVLGTILGVSSSYDRVNLYVPVGCRDVYRNAPEWEKFSYIYEFGETSAVNDIDQDEVSAPQISTTSGQLIITVTESQTMQVFDLAGHLVSKAPLSAGSNTLNLPAGIYVVTLSGGFSTQIIIP